MIDDIRVTCSNYLGHEIKVPVYAWRVWIAPDVCRYVEAGKEPNRFHRFMQQACLGFIWERIK